jgi:hypothetical protein
MPQKMRFPFRIACNVTEEIAMAFDAMAAGSNLTASDFMRDALDTYLRARGMLAPPSRQSNGAMHPAE